MAEGRNECEMRQLRGGAFYEDVVIFNPAIAQIGFEVGPLVDGGTNSSLAVTLFGFCREFVAFAFEGRTDASE
jgi:hypothetical protein